MLEKRTWTRHFNNTSPKSRIDFGNQKNKGKRIYKSGSPSDTRIPSNAIHEAARKAEVDAVKFFLQRDKELIKSLISEKTVLCSAVVGALQSNNSAARIEVFKLLRQYGADINSDDSVKKILKRPAYTDVKVLLKQAGFKLDDNIDKSTRISKTSSTDQENVNLIRGSLNNGKQSEKRDIVAADTAVIVENGTSSSTNGNAVAKGDSEASCRLVVSETNKEGAVEFVRQYGLILKCLKYRVEFRCKKTIYAQR